MDEMESSVCAQLIGEVAERVYDSLSGPAPEVRRRLQALARELEGCWSRGQLEFVEGAYAIGFVLFHLPELSSADVEEVQRWLGRVLEREPDHWFAAYHLALAHYHAGLYAESLVLCQRAGPPPELDGPTTWRWAKLSEVMLCCSIDATPDADVSERVLEVLSIHHDPDDAEPLPEELLSTLTNVAQRGCRGPQFVHTVELFVRQVQALEHLPSSFRDEATALGELVRTETS